MVGDVLTQEGIERPAVARRLEHELLGFDPIGLNQIPHCWATIPSDMLQRPSAFHDAPALDPTTLLCLDIDVELRDAWELLDQVPDVWDDLHLAVVASAMRVAYERGRRRGETAGRAAGYQDGYEDGHEEGYDTAFADVPA